MFPCHNDALPLSSSPTKGCIIRGSTVPCSQTVSYLSYLSEPWNESVHISTLTSESTNRVLALVVLPSQSTASRLASTASPSNLNSSLPQVHFETLLITASKTITIPAQSGPPNSHSIGLPSASPNSLHRGLQVHLSMQLIFTSTCSLN